MHAATPINSYFLKIEKSNSGRIHEKMLRQNYKLQKFKVK